jgi:hypothetical protein
MANKKASSGGIKDKIGIAREFESVDFGDKRLKKRLTKIAEQFASAPEANIPQACGDWAGSKASYRFFDNDGVKAADILGAHRRATLERMRAERVIFAIQDTTSLNYSGHRQTQGLGPIGNNKEKTLGLIVHSTLAVNESGLALGLLDAAFHARKPEEFRSKTRGRNRQRIQEKESYKWLSALEALDAGVRGLPEQTRVVSLSDRESDLYELFLAAILGKESGGRVDLLVRASQRRRIEQSERYLWDWLPRTPRMASLMLQVPRAAGRRERTASLSIRFCKVTLRPPVDRQKYQKQQRTLDLWAIEAREEHPAAGLEPLCWRLLSTMEVGSLEQALEKVRWYTLRWQIEVFHKVLKNGCRVQERQLESAERLKRCLALDMVVAWRILILSKLGRKTPELPADILFQECEWKALYCHKHKTRRVPVRPPTLGDALKWVAQLGGFLARRSDGHPGPVVLWRGLKRLEDITNTWLLFNKNKLVGND